jgi:hypothetical protein
MQLYLFYSGKASKTTSPSQLYVPAIDAPVPTRNHPDGLFRQRWAVKPPACSLFACCCSRRAPLNTHFRLKNGPGVRQPAEKIFEKKQIKGLTVLPKKLNSCVCLVIIKQIRLLRA